MPSPDPHGLDAAASRDEAVRRADEFLKQGRLDAAVAIYERVAVEQPNDWTVSTTLGDLYVRAGQQQKAIGAYLRVAEHLAEADSLAKAAAVYKKILQLSPDEEEAELRLAEISVRQRLFADAKAHLASVAARRRVRGDHVGAQALLRRIDGLDPTDFDARLNKLRILAAAREACDVGEVREVVAELRLGARGEEAIELLRLTRSTDPMLLVTLAELELGAGRLDEGRNIFARVLRADHAFASRIREVAVTLLERDPDAALVCLDAIADAAAEGGRPGEAADILEQFLVEAPWHVPAALKLVEICIDAGLEGRMYVAQARLADAYLAGGKGIEAKVIAEDLLAGAPDDRRHLERLRRAEALLRDQSGSHHNSAARETVATAGAPQPPAKPRADRWDTAEVEINLDEALGELEAMQSGDGVMELPKPAAGESSPDEAFLSFREEVWRDSSDEAAEQQYKLAIAYREMDMIEEAVQALELAARSPGRRFEAASLLGRFYRDMGLVGEAVEWLERAAETPPPGIEEGRVLLYDLGDALEHLGETERALAVFLELEAEAGSYRDIAARVARLTSQETEV